MRTHEKKKILAQIGVVLVILLLAGSALAQSLSLMAPSLANVRGRLTARFGVAVEEKPILKGELEDGGVLVLKCQVRLIEANDYWFNRVISEAQFESILKFDPLTRDFIMSLPDRETLLRNTDLGKLLDEGWGTIEASLGEWALLDRGRKYSLLLHTSMNEQDAPEGVMRYIYFWSWDAGADNSFQLDFTF
ncbi:MULTISPECIES: DUF4390 domain-containing protein [unclassified Pseudodesulfovibrio]|uniref:DUF4390 domain-containing protein n=1 Tax=unclassified Pseudodesulfovibrio TaxID=2661612 RepID=UPI000FEBCABC|nr:MULTISPECIES: DUF4390 domain-containing protein [unclassified Pseudodesulfovibrio]MCJ2165623.1 DUF4390 domain-containing protein [Pseudodesulfovibrio sp. S3-i]RWU03030.1 DUF4390 domain-containing protein [Pseudodesulfovibrio sp. S3]